MGIFEYLVSLSFYFECFNILLLCEFAPLKIVYFLCSDQGSKLGWSCGPSLPKLLSDHQIVLGGGPVVYWKTRHKRTVFKIF